MRWTAIFVVAGIGVLCLVAGILKFLPGGVGLGAAWMFWALLLFGLSFIKRPATDPDDPPALSPVQQFFGIFYMPGTVFRSLRRQPTWLLPLIVVTLLSSIYMFAFTKRVGPERIADQMTTKTLQSFVDRGWMTPAQVKERHEAVLKQFSSKSQQIVGVFSGVVGTFARWCFAAGIIMLLVLIFGGRINFWQSLSVVAWVNLAVVVITKVLSLPILYLKDPDQIHPVLHQESIVQDSLSVLFDPAANPVLFVLAGLLGVLTLYRLWLTVTGLKNAGEKVGGTAAWGTTITIFVVLAIGLVLLVTFFPGSIS